MVNEKAPCPYCNELIWVGVPDGYQLAKLKPAKYWDSNAHTRMFCPDCGGEIAVWLWKNSHGPL